MDNESEKHQINLFFFYTIKHPCLNISYTLHDSGLWN